MLMPDKKRKQILFSRRSTFLEDTVNIATHYSPVQNQQGTGHNGDASADLKSVQLHSECKRHHQTPGLGFQLM
jgi:hypothetical protein